MKKRYAILAGSFLSLMVSVPSYAETESSPPPPHAHHCPDATEVKGMQDHLLNDLHEKLKITSQQESAWGTFASSFKSLIKPPVCGKVPPVTIPEKIEAEKTMANSHLNYINTLSEPTLELYSKLNDEQKTIMDNSFIPGLSHPKFFRHEGHEKPVEGVKK